jgi:hypothetical protein
MSESNDKRWQEEEVREKPIIFLIQIQILQMRRRRSVGHWRRQSESLALGMLLKYYYPL